MLADIKVRAMCNTQDMVVALIMGRSGRYRMEKPISKGDGGLI